MVYTTSTKEEWIPEVTARYHKNVEKANRLKQLILGRGDEGGLSFISELLGDRFNSLVGRDNAILMEEEFIDCLIKAGYSETRQEVVDQILPTMDSYKMCYKDAGSRTYSLVVQRLINKASPKIAYRVSRIIG